MERSIESRKPAQDSQGGLSKISKVYFGVDIFQGIFLLLWLLHNYVPRLKEFLFVSLHSFTYGLFGKHYENCFN